jgi:hypothetical protein
MRRVVMCALSLSVASLVGCSQPAPPPPFKAVVDTKTLMDAVIEKQANIVWESVGTFITAEGIDERRPQTEQEWKNVKDAAVTITESANLLLIPARLQGGDQWLQFTKELIAQGERMIAAAEKKSPDDVFNVGADLYDACVNCHTNYMPGVREMYKR